MYRVLEGDYTENQDIDGQITTKIITGKTVVKLSNQWNWLRELELRM
jgi:hypothetical protein